MPAVDQHFAPLAFIGVIGFWELIVVALIVWRVMQ